MSFLRQFPDRVRLLKSCPPDFTRIARKVNNHIHSPYSFSAFKSIEEAVQMAASENVSILGINDFYVTDAYGEFIRSCQNHGIFPLMNIELIGISSEDQAAGTRINDPGNPGRIYVSGKGLAFPSVLSAEGQRKLDGVVEESNKQVAKMLDLVNRWMEFHQSGITLSMEEIMKDHAMNLLRERHVAKALRLKLEESATRDEEFFLLLEKIYGGISSGKKRDDIAGLEDELRARLLKSGAPAFVPEDEKAFMSLEQIMSLIGDAGGIPTYPMLLDGAGGGITEFENSKEQLLEVLKMKGFRSVEMIPLRNRIEVLKEYAEYFYENGFVVSYGTEHNTTAMSPLSVSCKNEVELDESLMQISYKGAAYLAAHQYLFQKEGKKYGKLTRDEMEALGFAVLHHYSELHK